MMKKFTLLTLSFAVGAALLSSCGMTALSTTPTVTYKRSIQEVRAYEPSTLAPLVRPLTADIEVVSEERICDTWTFDITPSNTMKYIRKTGDIPQELKVKALAKSANKYGADMIIAPMFDYEQTTDFETDVVKSDVVVVTVTGYPAKFKNWKPVSAESGDYEWIGGFYGIYFPTDNTDKKSSNISVVVNGEEE